MIPADALYDDPVDSFDRRWHDRSYHREVVRAQLRDVPWNEGATIGELTDGRCRASRLGHRCERKATHVTEPERRHRTHVADGGALEWGGA